MCLGLKQISTDKYIFVYFGFLKVKPLYEFGHVVFGSSLHTNPDTCIQLVSNALLLITKTTKTTTTTTNTTKKWISCIDVVLIQSAENLSWDLVKKMKLSS